MLHIYYLYIQKKKIFLVVLHLYYDICRQLSRFFEQELTDL